MIIKSDPYPPRLPLIGLWVVMAVVTVLAIIVGVNQLAELLTGK